MIMISGALFFLFLGVISPGRTDEVFCYYNGTRYAKGEVIKTEHVCYHCTCYDGWTSVGDDQCIVIDCPWQYYGDKPHCRAEDVPDECCPRRICGPWSPDHDRRILSGKRSDISMHGINITFSPGTELTLFCVGKIKIPASENTTAVWLKQSMNGVASSITNGDKFKIGRPDGITWALYIENLTAEDEGRYICVLETPQRNTYHTFLKLKEPLKKRHNFCYHNNDIEREQGCLLPVPSNYFYNVTSGLCEVEKVTTCTPWGNHFPTHEECLTLCYDDPCYQPLEPGPCTNHIRRYFYDKKADTCRAFIYSGCRGNRNNFETHEECRKMCVKLIFEGQELPSQKDDIPLINSSICQWRLWMHYLMRRCEPVYGFHSSCPIRFECRRDFRNSATNALRNDREGSCVYRGIRYKIGEEINLTDSCQMCSCHWSFKGPGDPSCRPLKCEEEAQKILRNTTCIPIYGEEGCCPLINHCTPSHLYAQVSPREFHTEPSDLRCGFGMIMYPRGYRLITGDPCLVCVCLTPPQFTCQRSNSCLKKVPSNSKNTGVETPEGTCQRHTCPEGFVCEVKPTIFPKGHFIPTCRKTATLFAPLVSRPEVITVCRISCSSTICHIILSPDYSCPICLCDTKGKIVLPCADVICNSSCTATPSTPNKCSRSCTCPKSSAEACQIVDCPKDSRCSAEEFTQVGADLPSCIACKGDCNKPCKWMTISGSLLGECRQCICPLHKLMTNETYH